MSKLEFAKTNPISPSMVNKKIKNRAKKDDVLISIEPPHKLANQLKTFIHVGTAIIMVGPNNET